ncbi:MAG: site-2 protease family protein [Balneolaceae bacterium]|nr:MAG: site-2 protease family protein [Balneolaceae bacterium]
MSSSLNLGNYAGIRVQIHWTFWLLFLFIGFLVYSQGGSWETLFWHSLFIITIFLCVVLHEFGHALTARKFGIGTRNITLLPIGGVANLKKVPENPKDEFWIAVAGPAVNIVIAGFLFFFVSVDTYASMDAETLQEELGSITSGNFLFYLFMANIALVLFNMIPAFPMDGGRVFRSLLAMKLGRVEATRIAAGLGKFLAVFFFLFGLFYNILLAVIAVFIWFGAHSENIMIQQIDMMDGYKIRDAMITEFSVLHPDKSLGYAVDRILATTEQDFIVMEQDRIAGILYMADLAAALKTRGRNALIRDVIDTDFFILKTDEPLYSAYRKLKRDNRNFFPVTEHERLVGVLDMNNINEFLTFRSAFDY